MRASMPAPPPNRPSSFVPLPGRSEPLPKNSPVAASGFCAACNTLHSLPRSPLAEEVANQLRATLEKSDTLDPTPNSSPNPSLSMTRLERDTGGKMFGVLLCETPEGELGYLKAFSGQFNRIWTIEGWAPPVLDVAASAPHQARVEERVSALTEEIKALKLQQLPLLAERERLTTLGAQRVEAQVTINSTRREQRALQRDNLPSPPPAEALTRLNHQSRDDKEALRTLRRASEEATAPLADRLANLQTTLLSLSRERRALSREVSLLLHTDYTLHNLRGAPRPLTEAFTNPGIPTGAGDCCAPKLLNYAAQNCLRPRSLAEFWMGTPKREGRHHGHFYPACEEKCAPLLGFMLCEA